VPKQVVEYLQIDSQLAALLADNVASILASQSAHAAELNKKLFAAMIAGDVAEAFVPGLGLATFSGVTVTSATVIRHMEEQDSRVALELLVDAGYDIRQAPVMWSILEAKESGFVESTTLPGQSKYLYRTNHWKNLEKLGSPGGCNRAKRFGGPSGEEFRSQSIEMPGTRALARHRLGALNQEPQMLDLRGLIDLR
jgi:hypothetical protein